MKGKRSKILALGIALIAVVALAFGVSSSAFADAGDPPAHTKSLSDNGDGTYKIELTVTGDAETEKLSDTHVNVLIVYDESSSMNTRDARVGGRDYTRADVAEDAMYTLMNGLVGYKARGVDIYAACIGFGTGTDVRSGWTDNLTSVRSLFDQGVDGTTTNTHAYNSHNGTAWAAALNLANSFLGSNTAQQPGLERLGREDYPTFVIFVTDGGPTVSPGNSTTVPGANVPWTSYRVHYNAATTYARNIQNRENTTLYGIYAFGSDANLLDDLMYYANTGSHRTVNGQSIANAPTGGQNHDFGEDEGAEKYYNASNAEALNQAISEIFNEIVEAMGITDVGMSDGTTSQVTASSGEVTSLLGVDEGSYKYWMDIPLNNNNQFMRTKNVNGSAEDITYTITDNGDDTCTVNWTEGGSAKTVTLNGSVNSHQFKFEWTEANEFYEYGPNDAKLVEGAVKWDLTNVGVLLDGVTYSVTFDVYPSQTAMDYKAKLDNGEAYTDVVPAEARPYFDSNGKLDTNTEGTITYSDTRLDEPGPKTTEFVNPPAVSTQSESMPVQKSWEGGNPPTGIDLKMDVVMDDEETFETVTLNSGNSWSADIKISYGIMKDGVVMEDAPGHDFSFAELGSEQYRWELVAPTVHPMIIDGTPTMLILKENKAPFNNADGGTEYVIDGKTYYVDEAITALSATNYRRSNLNIKKVVSNSAPEGTEFPFSLTINNPKAEGADQSDTSSDYYVWFSIRDADNKTVMDPTVDGATAEIGPDGNPTGYFYAEAGKAFTFSLEDGWNLRVTNLPSDTTYTATEGELTGFELEKAESTGATDRTFSFDADTSTATGTIVTYNAQAYEATFTNKSTLTDITITKVWDDESDHDGLRPSDDDFLAALTVSPAVEVEPTITKSSDGNTWTITWAGVPAVDSGYTVTESEIDHYTTEGSPAQSGGTITNSHTPEVTTSTVTKVWEDGDDQDGIRPKSLVVTLYANGTATSTTATLSDSAGWSHTETGLDKYSGGQEIVYTWAEDESALPTGYTASTDSADGTTTITNSYTPAETSATVKKIWDDNGNQDGARPTSLTVKLLADGEDTGKSVTLSDSNEWTDTIVGLPVNASGSAITYTWDEGTITDYTKSKEEVSGTTTTITNTHNPATIDIEVTKVWEDGENQDGIRPDSVTVKLLADGEDTGKTVTLSESNGWKDTFEGLDQYKPVKQEITYTVEEVKTDVITGEDGPGTYADVVDGYLVTNTHTPEKTTIDVTKVWSDNDDQDGIRPTSVTVNLLADGTNVASLVLDEQGGWAGSFGEVDKYKAGKKITYTIAEETTSVITGTDGPGTYAYNVDGTTVTNTHTPEKTTVNVTKIWDDADDRDGIRPSSVTVTLLANGEPAGDATLSESNSWTYTWTGLDKYAAGDEIAYEVSEEQVEGYDEPEISGDAKSGFKIKNHHLAKPDKVYSDPPVKKIVKGNPAKDETFTFQMKALDGGPMPEGSDGDTKTVQITGSGEYEFGNMYFSEAGTWTYSITEVDGGAKGYTYDTTEYTLTVTVTEVEDGTQVKLSKTETITGGDSDTPVFTNEYKSKGGKDTPKTGDSTPLGLLAILLGMSGALFVASGARMRRER